MDHGLFFIDVQEIGRRKSVIFKLLNSKTSDNSKGPLLSYYIIFIHHLVFLCNLHHIFESYVYIIVF